MLARVDGVATFVTLSRTDRMSSFVKAGGIGCHGDTTGGCFPRGRSSGGGGPLPASRGGSGTIGSARVMAGVGVGGPDSPRPIAVSVRCGWTRGTSSVPTGG